MLVDHIRSIIFVCLYHSVIMIGSILILILMPPFDGNVSFPTGVALAAGSGAFASALTASRYVVLAVREQKYDVNRLPWQILTPLHGAALAVAGSFIYHGPFDLENAANAGSDPQSIIVVSFLIGFAAEIFVKRLIAVAEAFFGEGEGGTTIQEVGDPSVPTRANSGSTKGPDDR